MNRTNFAVLSEKMPKNFTAKHFWLVGRSQDILIWNISSGRAFHQLHQNNISLCPPSSSPSNHGLNLFWCEVFFDLVCYLYFNIKPSHADFIPSELKVSSDVIYMNFPLLPLVLMYFPTFVLRALLFSLYKTLHTLG